MIGKNESEFHQLESLMELALILSQQMDFEEILRIISQKAATLLHAEISLIFMVNPQTRDTVKTIHIEGKEIPHKDVRPLHIQVNGWILQKNKPLLSRNINQDARFRAVKLSKISVKSVLGAPLQVEGTMIGSLVLFNKRQKGEFDEDNLSYLEKIAVISAPYLRNVQKIQQFFATPLPEQSLLTKYNKFGLVGKGKKFVNLLRGIEAAARCDVRVVLEGQSGTGKELVARAIHKLSSRNQGPFVAIDCGAITPNLLESELFGHVRGAFTGASFDRKGLLEEAHRGTIFMDEIANMPIEMQSKFMRVLQEGEIKPVGSNKVRKIDVRIISASSTNLQKLVEKIKFREDLFYRLYVYPLVIPSLNERREDIPKLANHFLQIFSRQQGKQIESLSAELFSFIQQRPWQGNIRELENFIERLVTLTPPEAETVTRKFLTPAILKELKKSQAVQETLVYNKTLEEMLADYEDQIIRKTLSDCNWNQSKAARVLSVSEQTVRYKIKKLGIARPS